MESLIAGLIGVVLGFVLENIGYVFKRRNEKIMELSDDLIVLLIDLEMLYQKYGNYVEIMEKHMMIRQRLIRILRYRSHFWQHTYNRILFDDLKSIENYEAPKIKDYFLGEGHGFTEINDWKSTCEKRAEMLHVFIVKIEKLNPFF